jgi:hypothetical protein
MPIHQASSRCERKRTPLEGTRGTFYQAAMAPSGRKVQRVDFIAHNHWTIPPNGETPSLMTGKYQQESMNEGKWESLGAGWPSLHLRYLEPLGVARPLLHPCYRRDSE